MVTLIASHQVDAAYNKAKTSKIWHVNSYAMVNAAEYWAEAVGVWLGVNQYLASGEQNVVG